MFVKSTRFKQVCQLLLSLIVAKRLHQQAGVPEGPRGYEELEKFQTFLGPQSYKIIVVDYVSCAFIFQGNVDQYSKVIYLLKHENHYNGLRSIIAFLNRSYFCPDCCKGYDVDDAANHSCRGRNCTSCQRTRSKKNKGGCPDFSPGKKRTIHCKDCHKVNPKQQHKCYHDTCRHCHEFVEIYNHKCYIQRVEDVDDEELDDDDDDDDEEKKYHLSRCLLTSNV